MALLFTWTYIRSAFLITFIRVVRGESGTLEDKVSGDAAFAGGSFVVTATAPGSIRFLVRDRESVRIGQVIAEVTGQGTAKAFDDSLAFARSRLAEYEAGTSSEFEALSGAIQSAYEEAVRLFFRVQKAYASGDHPGAQAEEKRFLDVEQVLLEGRDKLTSMEDERTALERMVAGIEAAQKSSSVQVLAPASGVFSLEVTNVDVKFTAGALASKDASELIALVREARDAKVLPIRDGQAVSAGDVIGRVISGQEVGFFLPVKTEDRPDVKPGKEIAVFMGSSALFEKAVVTSVTDGKPPGYSIIAGEIPFLSADRVAKWGAVSLVTNSRSGIVIPESALLIKDGKTGLLAVQKTYARFVPVEVLMTKGGRAVVRGISESDEIVRRAMTFLEGKRVR